MHQYYLSSLPVPFARGIAGFWNKPFQLKRNECPPPKSLQRLIFPFVERAYDNYSEEVQKRWLQECEDEMNEVNQNNFDGDDDELEICT
ncbi:hypothetical protein BGX26_009551, partial [Mortierella sp. AD094]